MIYKNRKYLITIILLTILLVFSACDGTRKDVEIILDDPNVNDKGIFPIVKEEIELDVLIAKFPQVENFNTNYATKWIKEKTGIKLNFQVVDVFGVAERLNPMLNSNAPLPDIIFPGPWFLDNNNKFTYGQAQQILPLNLFIEKFSTELVRLWEEIPGMEKQMISPDGNIYALTNYSAIEQTYYGAKTYINTKFLNNLGLDTPKNLDEFEYVLQQFREKDANKNGNKNDEIPFTGYVDFFEFWIFLMNSFIYCDNSLLNLDSKGNVYAPFVKDEWREGLKYMRKLYAQGLIDEEIFTQNKTAVKNLVNGNYVRPGVITAVGADEFSSFGSSQMAQYKVLEPLRNPNSDRIPTVSYYPPYAHGGTFVITRDCKHQAAAYRLGDFLLSDEAQRVLFFGEQEVDWVYPEENEIAIDGLPATIKLINTMYAQNIQNKAWLWSAPQIDIRLTDGNVRKSDQDIDVIIYSWAEKLKGYKPETRLPFLTFLSEDLLDASIIRGQILSYVTSSVSKFIIGDLDINDDEDWKYYLNQLKLMELNKLLALSQEAYDRQYS